jgi:hypothetical protein
MATLNYRAPRTHSQPSNQSIGMRIQVSRDTDRRGGDALGHWHTVRHPVNFMPCQTPRLQIAETMSTMSLGNTSSLIQMVLVKIVRLGNCPVYLQVALYLP